MKVGFFSTQLSNPGGPALVDNMFLRELARQDQSHNTYTVYDLTGHDTEELEPSDNFTIRRPRPGGKWGGVALGMTLELLRRPVDLLHTGFVPPPVVPCPFIATMTCWSQYDRPDFYPPLLRWRLQYLLDRGVPRAAAVFCYTEYLKEKVMERFGVAPERIFVTRPAVGGAIRRITDEARLESFLGSHGIKRPYLLFIGSLTRRKNVHRLVEAYHQLVREAQIPHQLVLLGETLFLADEIFQTIDELGLRDRIVLPGRQKYEDLPLFYSGADLFVFPTLSEGFGLPPLEAMACGTPVVASDVTCVPEVLGESALYFDPERPEEIADAILKALTDVGLREEMVSKGKAHVAGRGWADTTREIIEAYDVIHAAGW